MSRVVTLLFVLSLGLAVHAQTPSSTPARPAAPAKPTVPAAAKPAAPKATAPATKTAPPKTPAAAAVAPAPVAAAPAVAPLATDEDKTLYALGLALQRSIQPFDLSASELAIVMRAVTDGAAGKPALELTEWGPRIDPLAGVRRQRAAERIKVTSAAYLVKAATETGAVKTPSGLVYRDILAGIGASPKASDTVKVHYRGTLTNGTVFDSSYERNEPVAFPLAGVIPCWTEGVQRMRVGGKAQLVCPSSLAYGDGGSPDIPGGATLIFEIELLEIVAPGATTR